MSYSSNIDNLKIELQLIILVNEVYLSPSIIVVPDSDIDTAKRNLVYSVIL